MRKMQAFLVLGFIVTLFLSVGFFIQKENERSKRIETEKMLVSAVEEKARMVEAIKGEALKREKTINRLFTRLEKEQKINSILIANIRRKGLRLSVALEDKKEVELQKIVVTSLQELEGKVLAVDKQSNLVVINLGNINNVKLGDRFSVYRDTEFVADIELIKIQNQLSAGAVLSEEKGIKVAVNDLVRRF